MNMGNKIIALFLLTFFIATVFSPLAVHANSPYNWSKIDPRLAEMVKNPSQKYEVIVKLKDVPKYMLIGKTHDMVVSTLKEYARSTQAPIESIVTQRGGEVLHSFWLMNAILVKADFNTILLLTTFDNVERIFPNYRITIEEPLSRTPINPDQSVESWGIFRIHAPDVWAMGYTGEGVRIAVLDTGVDITHPALAGKMLTLDPTDPHYPGGWMEWDNDGNPICSTPHDTDGHGTHTSGTALGGDTEDILIGVAPGATLMHGLVLPGGSGSFAQVMAGMEWTVDPYDCDGNPTGLPAHVVSMSWGASGYYDNDLLPAIENMLLAGIIPVAAIGNDGPGITSNPGNIWGVFGVGATDETDNVAWFSSGEVVNWPSPPASWPFFGGYPSTYMKPDFSAPGVDIVSSVPGGGYEAWMGTSMATPHVTGTVALVLQAMGALDYQSPVPEFSLPELVYLILNQTAEDFGDPGQDIGYGWGIINAYNAVETAMTYAKKSGVTGFVSDAETGEPIVWASVFVQEINRTFGVNESGGFKIPLDPGTYHLTFQAWGYQSVTVEVNVTAGNGTLVGVVTDALTGMPITNATATIIELGQSFLTNASGIFTATMPAGTYTVIVSAPGYENQTKSVTINENETTIEFFELLPAGNGTISGYVFDSNTSAPIPNATIAAVSATNVFVTFTDASGYYELSLPADIYDVIASAPGYLPQNVSGIMVLPNTTTIVNFTLTTFAGSIVVLGDAYGHIPTILESYGIPSDLIVTYNDSDTLINDWSNGTVMPKVLVIDHWYADESTPDNTTVLAIIGLAELSGTEIVFLDTPYSGATGGKGLYYYDDEIESYGYPAPDDYIYGWPTPDYVKVTMLDPTHPIFNGVVPDNDSWFYLADLANSDYADYIAFYFYDDDFAMPLYLANITDDSAGEAGTGIAAFMTPAGNAWIFLASWAESDWMQYLEPGIDGMYSNNTATVLFNAVNLTYTMSSLVTSPEAIATALSMLKSARTSITGTPEFGKTNYTVVNVSLERLPYGYIAGAVTDTAGNPIAGATVAISGAPFTLTTDENGTFTTWLPAGNYTVFVSAPGYKSATANVTINVNETTTVSFALEEAPRLAILYDFNGELKSLITSFDPEIYVEDFNSIDEFTDAIASGFFWGAIVSGYYAAPMPTEDQFFAMLDAIESQQMSVVWLGNWYVEGDPDFGYGIRMLHEYLGDPGTLVTGWGTGAVYYGILQSSPIFDGYGPGDVVGIVWDTAADWLAFDDFSGELLATVSTDSTGTIAGGVGVKYTSYGSVWILMASLAPEEWTDTYYWTEDAMMFVFNAAKQVLVKRINLTLNETLVHVGDAIEATISDAPANTTFTIAVAGTPLANVTTDANGTATFVFTVPALPMGDYAVTATSLDMTYLGAATFTVVPEIIIGTEQIAQGALATFMATGLPANEVFFFLIDSNVITTFMSGSDGTATLYINIPLYVEAGVEHAFNIAYADNGTVLVSTAANVYPGYIIELLQEIANGTNASAGLTSEVLSQLNQLGLLINTTASDLETMISSGKADIIGLLNTKSGDILAVLDTMNGTILARLTDIETGLGGINASIQSSTQTINSNIETAKGEIINTLSGNIDSAKNEVLDAITSLNQSLSSTAEDIKQSVPSSTSTNAAAGMATLAFLASLGAIVVSRRG